MTDFHTASDLLLNQVADFFDSSWPGADVDILEDAVLVTLSKGTQYVINRHGVTQQIWLSSPFSGAHHFVYQEGRWRCTRTHVVLEDLLLDERNSHVT